jgi:hypothetical protein
VVSGHPSAIVAVLVSQNPELTLVVILSAVLDEKAVFKYVAVVAVPVKFAVIVPALKLPEASLATIVEAVFAFVAFEVTVKVVAPV